MCFRLFYQLGIFSVRFKCRQKETYERQFFIFGSVYAFMYGPLGGKSYTFFLCFVLFSVNNKFTSDIKVDIFITCFIDMTFGYPSRRYIADYDITPLFSCSLRRYQKPYYPCGVFTKFCKREILKIEYFHKILLLFYLCL